ncbi:Calx-beta domain-containing protein, partial [Inhella crocodyli]
MPVITKSHDTVVVDLQGQAFIRRADGQLHPLKLGDKVMRGDLILTSQDGIVELADPRPEDLLAAEPPATGKPAASTPLDRVIEGLAQSDPSVVPAAGTPGDSGGDSGAPALRVDRVTETIDPASVRSTGVSGSTVASTEQAAQAQPEINVADVQVGEADGFITFTITLSTLATQNVTVSYQVLSDTALANADFTPVSGTLTIVAGTNTAVVRVPVTNDTVFEGNESLLINLSSPSNATIGQGSAVAVIVDNDSVPTVSLITPPTATEGSDLVFGVTLSNASAFNTTLPFSLGGGTAAGNDYGTPTFTNGVTYNPATGTVTVPPGVTSFSVVVPTTPDTTDEPNETLPLSIGGVSADGTIVDDDAAPTVASVSSPSATEGSALVYAVNLTNASSVATTHAFTLGGGSADAGDFGTPTFSNGVTYNPATGTVTVPAGVTSFSVTVPTTPDTTDEPNETLPLSVGGVSGTGTILDDDEAPRIGSVSAPSATEGGDLVFAVTLTNGSSVATSYPFALGGGTAAGNDYGTPTFTNGVTYNPATGTVTVPPGVTSFSVVVPTTPDTTDEPNETLPLSIGGVSADGTIVDDDAAPTVASVSSPSATEGSALVYAVNLTNASSVATTHAFTLGGGSADAGDFGTPTFSNGVTYNPATGTVTVPAGVTSFSVTVPTTPDTTDEPNETLPLSVGGVSGTGTILDDDDAPTVSAISSPTAAEGATLVYTVSLSGSSSVATTHAFSLGGGTASAGDFGTPTFTNGVTYNAATGTITVPPGVTSFAVNVPSTQDSADEANETVPLSIGGVNATGTIVDDDDAPALSVNDVTVNEAAGTVTFTVSLSSATGQTVTVNYGTANGTATAGSDYSARSGTLTFAPGTTTQTVTVALTDDNLAEGSETFRLVLTSPTNATIAQGTGTATVLDNDGAPTIASVSSPSATEGADLVFDVALSNPSTSATTFAFSLGGGTAVAADHGSPSFSNGVTYNAATGTITVPAGVTSFSVTVGTTQDSTSEPTETLPLSVGGVSGTGSILDDDGASSIASVSSPSATEGNDLVFDVVLTNPSATDTTHSFNLGGGSAAAGDFGTPSFTNGVTYNAATGTITVPAGVTSFSVTVPTTADTRTESTETVPLSVGTVTGTGSIVDNDAPPTGTDATVTLAEDGSHAFSAASFGFTATDGDTLAAVRIDTLPGAGSLTLNGNPVTAGQVIAAADLANLVFTPAANANGNGYAAFTFSVQDSSGDWDAAPNTLTLDVTPVNDDPVANADTASTPINTAVNNIAVLANDTDVDGNPLSVTGA